MLQKNKNGIMVVIILAVIFGLVSGVVGELIARVYIFENAFNIPFFGEINFSNNNYGGSSLIIRDAKKVVVEQDTKVNETINSLGGSIVGIFKKIATTSPVQTAETGKEILAEFKISDSYQIKNELAQGFIITSDGWIITDYVLQELQQLSGQPEKIVKKAKENIFNKYVVITRDKEIYSVDNIVFDKLSFYSFWHIKASDLPVRKFALENEIHNGQLAIAVNWDDWAWLTTIIGQSKKEASLVQSSDENYREIILDQNPPKEFRGSYLFNLGGDLVGLINQEGKVEPISNYIPIVNSLLKNKEIKRASLGVNYIDLSRLVSVESGDSSKGALIYKNNKAVAVVKDSPADLAGLKENDIIISVNDTELDQNNNLSSVVSQYFPGDKVDIVYLRGDEEKKVKVKLEGIRVKN